jgi:hypothetical protein
MLSREIYLFFIVSYDVISNSTGTRTHAHTVKSEIQNRR